MPIGFAVHPRSRNVAAEWLLRFKDVAVAHASDNMSRQFHGGARLRPYHAGTSMVGVALTVRTRPGDNLLVHKALSIAERDDVIVVDAGGETTNAIVGELMLAYAASKGVAGVVINGAVRDTAAIRTGTLPVYACAVTHRGPYKDGPGELNCAVGIEGKVIDPGDLVIGDEDGWLSIPADLASTVYDGVLKTRARELRVMQNIRAHTHDVAWIDEALRARGCSGV